MIRAFIFDLDGTLIKSEMLKAQSYARATIELCPYSVTIDQVIDAFKDLVGLSRREVALGLMERFALEDKAAARMEEFGVSTPWQAFVQIRLRFYNAMLADPEVLRRNQWPHNMGLLRLAREHGCKTALATMSYCDQVQHVLDVLDLRGSFDFVVTREDVHQGKPHPEIYELVLHELNIAPEEALVIEDSANGVQAGLAAGIHVIAVSTPFTREALHRMGELPGERIVDDPADLLPTVRKFVTNI